MNSGFITRMTAKRGRPATLFTTPRSEVADICMNCPYPTCSKGTCKRLREELAKLRQEGGRNEHKKERRQS